MGSRVRAVVGPLVVTAVVLIADVATKAWARGLVRPRSILGGIRFVHASNGGAAFSILQGGGPWLGLLSAVAAVLVVVAMVATRRTALRYAAALVCGGTIGNGLERWFAASHHVTDFIDLRVWPVFNVADACITVGCLWIVVLTFTHRAPSDD